jgi:hypothetical protein
VLGVFLAAIVFATLPVAPVTVVTPDREVAARVEIVGATPPELVWARSALAGLGTNDPVKRIEFSDHGRSRKVLVVAPGGSANEWLGRLVASDIVGSAHAHGESIDWVEFRGDRGGDGSAIEPYSVRRVSRSGLRELGAEIALRARQHHHRVARIRAFQVADGGVEVILRLTRRELLLGTNARWLSDLIPTRRYEHLLLVFGPGGVPVGGGGTYGHGSGGFWAYGSLAQTAEDTPTVAGYVQLRLHIERTFRKRQTFDVALNCMGESEGERCASFRSDWVRLLAPVVEGVVCGGPVGADTMRIAGAVDGIAVRRSYDGCYGNTVLSWERLFGIPTQR